MLDINNIQNLITKLENKGIDVSLEKEKIYGTKNSMGSVTFSLSLNNSELIDTYNLLKSKMDKYNLLLSAYNYCNNIQANILKMYDMAKESKDEINMNELNSYISKIEDYLINLKQYENINLNIDKNRSTNMDFNSIVLTKIYEIVYYLIDIDILLINRSRLYNFMKDKKIETNYINSILYDEIKYAFNNNTSLIRKLKAIRGLYSIVDKLNENGIKGDYFYMEIIKLLLAYKSNYDISKSLQDEMNEYYKDFEDAKGSINEAKLNTYRFNYLKDISYEEKQITRKGLKNKIISLVLSLSILITGGLILPKLIAKKNTKGCFTKTTEITSSISEDTEIKKEKYFKKATNLPSEKYLYVLGPWENDFNRVTRDVSKYDVSYSDLSDYDNLDSIDIESLGIEPNNYTESIKREDATNLSKYKGNMRELESIDYNYEGVKFDSISNKGDTIYALIIYFLIGFLLRFPIFDRFEDGQVLFSFIKNYINKKNKFIYSKEELRNAISELNRYIMSNKDLLVEFNKFYEENKYLILDEDELKNKLNDMIIQIENSNNGMKMILEKVVK